MNANDQNHRTILISITRRVMLEQGLLPDFSSISEKSNHPGIDMGKHTSVFKKSQGEIL